MTTLELARKYVAAGLSVLPIAADGSKAPDGRVLPRIPDPANPDRHKSSWLPLQERLPTDEELIRWFGDGRRGIGIIGGAISGRLETLDFDHQADHIFPAWCSLVEAERPGLIDRLTVTRTPKPGCHASYRCPDAVIPGNVDIALDPAPASKRERVLIQTRGEGGYALAPGCPAACHPTGRLYEHYSGPELCNVNTITPEERDVLWRCAASFDRSVPPPAPSSGSSRPGDGLRPGDDFNFRGPDWAALLEPHGWQCIRTVGDVRYWRRPGKTVPGWSATTGVCKNADGRIDYLAVFSSNAAPFDGPSNGRNCTCYTKFAALTLLEHGGDYAAAARALGAQGYGEQGQRRRQAPEAVVANGEQPPPRAPELHLTDLGNARRVVAAHGLDLRYCHPWKSWLVWDGRRWANDQTAVATRRVKITQDTLWRETTEQIGRLPVAVLDHAEREAELAALNRLLKHCLHWQDARKINACLDLMRSEPTIPILPDQMDADPFLLNVANGTLDLRTGSMRPHNRSDLITKLCPVEYRPDASCPIWDMFLAKIMNGNQNLMGYLQRLAGYSLTGDVSEQCLFFFHGSGANGKSTYLNTIRHMLGDYACQAVPELLMVKHNESHPTERADLFGRRFVATIETEDGKRLAESLVKQLTGGEAVRARRMYQNFFEFLPTYKLFLAANHLPIIRGTDHAIWRRIKMLPFLVTIAESEKDQHLKDKLEIELPGILAWSVRGCRQWMLHGLGEPDEVRQATAMYQTEMDLIGEFIGECCKVHPELRGTTESLFSAYVAWSGDKLTTKKAFGKRLEQKGYPSCKGGYGVRCHRGVTLEDDQIPR